jgi:hypothetical protein
MARTLLRHRTPRTAAEEPQPARIVGLAEATLRRLGTDHFDLCQSSIGRSHDEAFIGLMDSFADAAHPGVGRLRALIAQRGWTGWTRIENASRRHHAAPLAASEQTHLPAADKAWMDRPATPGRWWSARTRAVGRRYPQHFHRGSFGHASASRRWPRRRCRLPLRSGERKGKQRWGWQDDARARPVPSVCIATASRTRGLRDGLD